MDELILLPTMKDVFNKINEKYPGWIINILDEYSNDYEGFTNNWKTIASLSKVPTQKIILVTNFANDDHLTYSELLTHTGFIVRTIQEIIPCKICNKALASKHTYDNLNSEEKRMFNLLPTVWNDQCSYH